MARDRQIGLAEPLVLWVAAGYCIWHGFPTTAQGVVVRRMDFEPKETQEARRADRPLWTLRSDLAPPPRAETYDFISASEPYGRATAGLRVACI
jgi:hypothetical protein